MRRNPACHREFRRAVLTGLAGMPRRIPCKYLYDEAGSALFDAICTLPEYPLTRAETTLLDRYAADIAGMVGPGRWVVELGAGSMRKTRRLLAALQAPAGYVPVDIAAGPLAAQARRLAAEFPGLAVAPQAADFTQRLPMPEAAAAGPALAFFPGSTIGNLRRPEALALLARVAGAVGAGGALLVGVDLIKERRRLEAAYDDAGGVTAAFTRNLLARLARELGAEVDPRDFDHRARWNAAAARVEIHLVSRRRQMIRLGGRQFGFHTGQAIHIEDSHKYDVSGFQRLAAQAGFRPAATWIEAEAGFSLHLLRPLH